MKKNLVLTALAAVAALLFLCGCAGPSEQQLEARAQFEEAMRDGDLIQVKQVVGANKKLLTWRDSQDRTILMQALCEEKSPLAAWLAEQDLSIDAEDTAGNTALLLAAGLGYGDVVHTLIEKGARVKTSNNAGRTALMEAARHGEAEICGLLLSNKASLSSTDSGGRTALIWAALAPRNQVETATVLLAAGAEINARDKKGDTALACAAKEGNLELVKFLLEKDAKLSINDKEGLSPFIWAIRNGRLDLVKFLLEKGAEVNPPESTALNAARRAQMYEIPRFFLNLTTRRELTPLMWAVKEGRIEVVRLLVEKGADVNAETVDGKSVIDFAPDAGIRQLLKKYNAY